MRVGLKDAEGKKHQQEIFRYITDKLIEGVSRVDIKKDIMVRYDLSQPGANKYIRNVYKKQLELDEKELSGLRFLQLNRLEKVYNEAMKRNDLRTAVSAADTINKLFSLYENKVKVEVKQDLIKFKFDNFDTTNAEDVHFEEVKNNICEMITEGGED